MGKKPTYEELEQRVDGLEKKARERAKLDDRIQLLLLAVEQSGEGMAVFDLDGNSEYLNDAFARMHGYTVKELIGKNLSILHTHQQMPSVEAANRQIKKTGNFKGEIWHVTRNGTEFPTLMHNSLLRDDTGNPIGIIGTLRDITDLKGKEAEIKASEVKFRELFNYMSSGVAVYEAKDNGNDFIFKDFNRAGEQIDNVKKEGLLGKSVLEIFPGVKEFGLFDVFKRVWETGKPEDHPVSLYKDERIIGWRENYIYKLPSGEIVAVYDDVTERKQAEEALRESEKKYRLLADNASDVIWTRDMNLNLTYLSSSIEKLTGYSVEESMALPNSERMTPASMESMNKIFEEELKLEAQGDADPSRARTIEIETICKDGSTVWIEVTVKFIRNQTGQAVWMLGISRDINERKQAEEVLRESEEKYRTIFNNAQVGLYRSRFKDGKMLIVNNRMAEIFGYESQEEAVADYVASEHYIDPGAREQLLAIMREHGKFTNFETQMTRRDNSIVWIQYSGTLYPEKGYFEGVAIDITNRKQTEEALRKNEEKYRTLLETTSEGCWLLNPELKTVEVNQAFCKMLGYSQDEMLGKAPFEFVDDENRKIFIEQTSKISTSPHRSYEITLKKKNGQDLHTYFNATTIKDDSGEVQVAFAFVTDITERKNLEVQLQQARKMEAIGALAGGIAHDFNNALFSIIGYTDLAMDDVPEGSLAQSNLKEVLIAANRAKDMVQQILAFSRQTETEKKPVEVQSVVKEAIKLLKTSIPTTIEIRQNIDANCKPVMADPTQIHQVVMNLATNAYHAMQEKGGVLKIDVAKEKISMDDSASYPDLHPGTYIKLSVSDTGHGIDKGVMEKIFDPYFTTKPVGQGTGMGLSTIHGIVKSHGGNIKVYSESGKGTVFHVYFPLIETKPVEPEIVYTGPVQKGSESILLVDDQEPIVSMIKQTLERLGYQVATRTSSLDALEAFRAGPDKFDLVITDMTMPNMTGVELAPRLSEIRPDIPIILCTGFSEITDANKAKALGIREFVMKPVVKDQIARIIRKVLDELKLDT